MRRTGLHFTCGPLACRNARHPRAVIAQKRWPDIDFGDGCLSVRRTLEEVRGKFQLREPKTPAARRRIDLRHTAASLLLMLGENPKVVQERLGHARVEVTLNTDSHVLPTLQKEAAEKLDRLLG